MHLRRIREHLHPLSYHKAPGSARVTVASDVADQNRTRSVPHAVPVLVLHPAQQHPTRQDFTRRGVPSRFSPVRHCPRKRRPQCKHTLARMHSCPSLCPVRGYVPTSQSSAEDRITLCLLILTAVPSRPVPPPELQRSTDPSTPGCTQAATGKHPPLTRREL